MISSNSESKESSESQVCSVAKSDVSPGLGLYICPGLGRRRYPAPKSANVSRPADTAWMGKSARIMLPTVGLLVDRRCFDDESTVRACRAELGVATALYDAVLLLTLCLPAGRTRWMMDGLATDIVAGAFPGTPGRLCGRFGWYDLDGGGFSCLAAHASSSREKYGKPDRRG